MTVSFLVLLNHGVCIPTILLLTSSEFRQATKAILVKVTPCLFGSTGNHETVALSKKDKALLVARQAAEWRRQQPCNAHALQTQDMTDVTLKHMISALKLRQENRVFPRSSENGPGLARNHQTPQILHVRPATTVGHRFSTKQHNLSGVMLRCADLRPMKNLDDPVHKIDCFKTF